MCLSRFVCAVCPDQILLRRRRDRPSLAAVCSRWLHHRARFDVRETPYEIHVAFANDVAAVDVEVASLPPMRLADQVRS